MASWSADQSTVRCLLLVSRHHLTGNQRTNDNHTQAQPARRRPPSYGNEEDKANEDAEANIDIDVEEEEDEDEEDKHDEVNDERWVESTINEEAVK